MSLIETGVIRNVLTAKDLCCSVFFIFCIIHFHLHVESSATRLMQEQSLSHPSSSSSGNRILACYYRPRVINDTALPADVCTHIIFAFATLSPNGLVVQNPADVASYRAVVKLKEKNPKLRVVLSANTGFQSVVNFGTETMVSCALGTVNFLNKYGFDGLDMDWEFPGLSEKLAFAEFLMILSNVLHNSNKTLSLAMPNGFKGLIDGYFVDTLNKYVDFMTVMTYDFKTYSKQNNMTDYNSPMYAPQGDDPFACTTGAFEFYLLLGVWPNKMLVGFPTYARTWELGNASVHGVHAPAVGFGAPGPVSHIPGIYLTQDICTAKKHGAFVVQDERDGAEYMVNNRTWVAFNGDYSVGLKTDFVKKFKLAGVGVWTFEFDDPNNVCGQGPYPILRNIRSGIGKGSNY